MFRASERFHSWVTSCGSLSGITLWRIRWRRGLDRKTQLDLFCTEQLFVDSCSRASAGTRPSPLRPVRGHTASICTEKENAFAPSSVYELTRLGKSPPLGVNQLLGPLRDLSQARQQTVKPRRSRLPRPNLVLAHSRFALCRCTPLQYADIFMVMSDQHGSWYLNKVSCLHPPAICCALHASYLSNSEKKRPPSPPATFAGIRAHDQLIPRDASPGHRCTCSSCQNSQQSPVGQLNEGEVADEHLKSAQREPLSP